MHFQGRPLSKLFSPPSENGSTLKGKHFLPRGAKCFLLELTSYQKGIGVLLSKQEVAKVVSLVNNG